MGDSSGRLHFKHTTSTLQFFEDDGKWCIRTSSLVNHGGTPSSSKLPMGTCEGDCDSDADCRGTLKCFHRSGHEQVPGCEIGAPGDDAGYDFCYDEHGGTTPVSMVALCTSCDISPGV